MARERSIEAAAVRLVTGRGGMLTKGDSDLVRGTPDRIGCYRGIPLALEFKRPGELGSRERRISQGTQLRRWRDAGAVAVYIDTLDQVKEILALLDEYLVTPITPISGAALVDLVNRAHPLPPIPAITHVEDAA